MPTHADFQSALPYSEFLSQHGTPSDAARWDQFRSQVKFTDVQTRLLQSFTRRIDILFLAGAWCGDCAFQCPIVERFAEVAPSIQIRYLDRDIRADLQAELQINGGNRVPVAVLYSEDGFEAARFGERPLSEYRRLAKNFIPDGIFPPTGDRMTEAVADWLEVVERVHWMLRLSPRIRRLHGD